MKREALSFLCGLAMASSLQQALAETRANPYQPIVEVNAFRLLPKPPPVVVDTTPPPPPPATTKITGISSLSGAPKVLLEITDATTKKVERPSPMLAGEKQGTIEVVSIDAEKGSVTIRSSGVESTLTFEKDGIKPTGASAAPVAMIAPPAAVAVPTPFPANTITPNNPRNVVMAGGGGTTTPNGSNPNAGFNPYANVIPPRPTRGVETSGNNNNYNPNAPRTLTREDQIILIEAQRADPNRVGPPLPPTHLTPPAANPDGTTTTPAPNAFPTLPVPPTFNGRLRK